MALLNRYNSLPASLPNKEFALVKVGAGPEWEWYVGDENNLPVPNIGGGGGSSNIAAGAFTGVFDVSTDDNRFYDDYTTGAVVNLSVSATKVLGAQARVRIKGDLIGTIPSTWYFSGDPISKNPAWINELTVMYVKEGDINLVNRSFFIDAGGFEPEYQEWLDQGVVNGFELPSATQQEIDNLKVKNFKKTGVWYELDKAHIFNAVYSPTSFAKNIYRQNFKDPTKFLLTADVGKEPDWISGSGFKAPASSGKFLKTGFKPTTHAVAMSANNASEIFGWFDVPTTYSSPVYGFGGRLTGENGIIIGNNAANQLLSRLFSAATTAITQANINSHYQFSKEKDVLKAYRNGTDELINTVSAYDSVMTNAEQFILTMSTDGAATTHAVPIGVKYQLSGASLRIQRLDIYEILNGTFE